MDSMTAIPELGSRYSYLRDLGRGGGGRVFLVHDAHLEEEVAFKLLDEPSVVLYREGETRAFHDLETDWADSFRRGGRDFVDGLLEDRELPQDCQAARETLRFALAAGRSAAEGRAQIIRSSIRRGKVGVKPAGFSSPASSQPPSTSGTSIGMPGLERRVNMRKGNSDA